MKIHISTLYRAKRYDGELTDEEAPLGIISEAIKKDSSIWEIMEKYIDQEKCYDKEDENDYYGVVWEQFKEHFVL